MTRVVSLPSGTVSNVLFMKALENGVRVKWEPFDSYAVGVLLYTSLPSLLLVLLGF